MDSATRFREGIERRVPHLAVVGRPDMSVVAFKAANVKAGSVCGHTVILGEKNPTHFTACCIQELNIYKLNDLMTKRGYHLNALQSPPALHFCFTAAHGPEMVDALLSDLASATKQLVSDPSAAAAMKGGSAPMYGMAGAVPDRGLVADFLSTYQDVMLEPLS